MTTAAIERRRGFRMLAVPAVLALVLVAAVLLQLRGPSTDVAPTVVDRAPLGEIVPNALMGWKVKDETLGPTEVANEEVSKRLNFDDHVFRRFENGAKSFSVYAAYWRPGKMAVQLVASHTPDRCWTEIGMRCVDMRFRQTYYLQGRALVPAEYRVFTPSAGGPKTFVAYWHMVAGKPYDYGGRLNAVPDPWRWWKGALAHRVLGSREQLFVRIASEQPIAELWQDGDFQKVMAAVARTALFAEVP